MAYARVRIGKNLAKLYTDQEIGLWALAHGLPDELANGRWTLDAMGYAAARAGRADVGNALADLLHARMIIAVEPGQPESVDFAQAYRFRPLLLGLGSDPDRPGVYGIGIRGQPWLLVDEAVHDIWRTAPLASSLWDACHLLEVGRAPQNRHTDIGETLSHVLERLHLLLSRGAGYLDLSETLEEAAPQSVVAIASVVPFFPEHRASHDDL
jgi:hypothetical protein